MCNLYSHTKSHDAMRHMFDGIVEGGEGFDDLSGNLPPMPGIWSDYSAAVFRHGAQGGRQLLMACWEMPTPPQFLAGKRTDPGVTKIRTLTQSIGSSATETRWRCDPVSAHVPVSRPTSHVAADSTLHG